MDALKLAVMAAAAAVLAGCGGSGDSKQTAPASPATQATTTDTPTAEAPTGRLSRAEYREVRAVYVALADLEGSTNLRSALRKGRPSCARLNTRTELIELFRATCAQAFRFFATIQELDASQRECAEAARAGDTSCFAQLFRSIARSARVAGVRERAFNRELRRRKIGGPCAKEIGASRTDLARRDAITRDAFAAARALEARDQARFQAAATRLQATLRFTSESGPEETLRNLQTCL